VTLEVEANMQNRLRNKVIVIAGAGGIGNGLAHRYAQEGASVVLGDIDGEVAQKAVDEIVAAGGSALGVALDGADDASIKHAVGLAIAKFGGLDGFHANFASFKDGESGADILDMPMEIYDEVMRVNARGFVLCTRHALPAMINRGGGAMIYTSSGAAYVGETVRLAYGMSKTAGHALMRHVAQKFGPQGIRANVIAPGVITHSRFDAVMPKELVEEFKRGTPIRSRLGVPNDIAAVGALLMSDDGSYITGQVISVDGGKTMRP
jgi:NAD(P)-dependent dehydrogenase (short-subunit alcohol dehydrogenase family)